MCEDGTFAALGHGISDNETGNVLDIKDGMIYRTRILSIIPGKNGEPAYMVKMRTLYIRSIHLN